MVSQFNKVVATMLLLALVTVSAAGAAPSSPKNSIDKAVLFHYTKGISGANTDYAKVLLEAVMKATEKDYGEYKIELNDSPMVRDRLRVELLKGELLNIASAPYSPDWVDAIRIPVPIRKGIGSYRLFMVRDHDVDLFKGVESIETIKKLRTGAIENWTTSQLLEHHKFNVVYGPTYASLFGMLSLGRFDTFMRGLNEVYDELEAHHEKYPNLLLERNAAILTYLPGYYYVSPRAPRLAQRIEYGLKKMANDGSFDTVFNSIYGDDIAAAKLGTLKIFYVENKSIPKELYVADKPYLLNFKLIGEHSDPVEK